MTRIKPSATDGLDSLTTEELRRRVRISRFALYRTVVFGVLALVSLGLALRCLVHGQRGEGWSWIAAWAVLYWRMDSASKVVARMAR